MVTEPEPVRLWETPLTAEPDLTLRGPGLLEPPAAHPERLCPELPLTALELRLEADLGVLAGEGAWRISADRRKDR